ncbi:MAG TPA: DNA sulfur modification protein DndE [Pyrinomonadaceae bacterium]|nr:DNA sulfur modification protein DndE [Pyrinomonadaceae bacterium]
MAIENIRLSQQARDQLIRLKRFTGIQNWNVLCRWAFCVSVAEVSPPAPAKIPADSSVEMTWKVFGGQHHEIYMAILKERCRKDGLGLDEETLAAQFRLHLHRGIGYLAAEKDIKKVSGLIRKVI